MLTETLRSVLRFTLSFWIFSDIVTFRIGRSDSKITIVAVLFPDLVASDFSAINKEIVLFY